MLVKCTPSAHRRGCNCLDNKQFANNKTIRLRLQQPTLFDWMKYLFVGKIPVLILVMFSVQSMGFAQSTNPDLTNP
ncbi:MAG: hypothetical protein ACI9XO_004305 [Paraglaciecola sp.]|jgi:hypothetical protein